RGHLGGRAGRLAIADRFLFLRQVARVEHEQYIHRTLPVLRGEGGDAVGKLRLYPVELEAVRRCNAQLAVLVVEGDQRFDPRGILLRCQLEFQLRGTGLPKVIHTSTRLSVTLYFTCLLESYPQARRVFSTV